MTDKHKTDPLAMCEPDELYRRADALARAGLTDAANAMRRYADRLWYAQRAGMFEE